MRLLVTLIRAKTGAVAVMFALALVPLIVAAALAVDYSFYVQAKAQLNLAADAAAMHAVHVASQALKDGDTIAEAQAAGVQAGQQWFAAQVGTINTASVPTSDVNASVTYTPTPGIFTATVSYTGTVSTHLGSFITKDWQIGGSASSVVANTYLEVLFMLDNSSSMQIGATPSDVLTMMQLTPCASFNAWYTYPTATTFSFDGDFVGYQCSFGGNTYPGTCPPLNLAILSPLTPASNPSAYNTQLSIGGDVGAPSCKGYLPAQANGTYPLAGAPCGFACHFDNTKPAGTGNDNYGLARSTIGKPNQVSLRFDLLKQATNSVLHTMQLSAETGNNLSVGIYSFNTALSQAYPANAEAGNDFDAAIAAVGGPASQPNQPDTGILPETFADPAGAHSDTDFTDTMAQLAAKVTQSGDGTTAASPRKVLILVTDGMENSDTHTGGIGAAVNVSQCQIFKNMGYTVYVIYTPYYPLMHIAYLAPQNNYPPIVTGTGPGTLSYNLQQCATASSTNSNFVEASDSASITAAMQNFLKSALNNPTRAAQ